MNPFMVYASCNRQVKVAFNPFQARKVVRLSKKHFADPEAAKKYHRAAEIRQQTEEMVQRNTP